MTNLELANFYNFLTGSEDLKGREFKLVVNMAIQVNIRKIRPVMEALADVEKKAKALSPAMEVYVKEERALVEAFTVKGQDDKPMISDNRALGEALAALQLKNAEALDEHKKKLADWEAFAKSDSDKVDIKKVKSSDLPESLSKETFEGLFPMIEE